MALVNLIALHNSVIAKGAEGGNGAEHAHSQNQEWQTDLFQELSCSPTC